MSDDDKLGNLKEYWERGGGISNGNIDWLISELEQCRKKLEYAEIAGKGLRDLNREVLAENKELQAVFDLQETRTKRAEKMWQQATGKHDTLPDLGVLLDWLMGEIKRLNKMQPVANVTLSDDAKYFEGLANKAEAEVKCLKSLLSYQGIPF